MNFYSPVTKDNMHEPWAMKELDKEYANTPIKNIALLAYVVHRKTGAPLTKPLQKALDEIFFKIATDGAEELNDINRPNITKKLRAKALDLCTYPANRKAIRYLVDKMMSRKPKQIYNYTEEDEEILKELAIKLGIKNRIKQNLSSAFSELEEILESKPQLWFVPSPSYREIQKLYYREKRKKKKNTT